MTDPMARPEDARARAPEPTRPARMDALATLPVFLKLRGRKAVLAGGSEPALWKAELLAAAGALVTVYARDPVDGFAALAADPPDGAVSVELRDWRDGDLDGAAIAIGALTEDAEADRFVAAAQRAGVPVNVVDRPEFCAFQFGAIVNRSPLVVAISTDGAAPVFGQAIRSRIEALLPQGFKRWAEAARSWRREGERLGPDIAARRRFWERFTERALAMPERVPAQADLESLIAEVKPGGGGTQPVSRGFVTLAGAGPGDPELLTLRAVRALRTADVVLYDALVTPEVLDFARRESERVLVGKIGYGPACKQTEINRLMIAHARAGKRVVRLKSGDPLIFGRGGEEIADLRAAGIAFDVVPGITAAQGAAARLGVSLTHRDTANRLQFITGHSRDGRLPGNLDWQALADPDATTVVYMANRTLAELRDRLTSHGLPATTPAIAVIRATRPDEHIVRSTIDSLPGDLAQAAISGPCLVLIGGALRSILKTNTAETLAETGTTGPAGV
jgi:uroporphyrin-III C-methyltransferase / precorrin-2 dehydrogenase / sirohydrochlorin ferrochelatase